MANEKRLIDANDYPCLKCEAYGCGTVCPVLLDWLNNTVDTVDAVEVVRCVKCKHYKKGKPFKSQCCNPSGGMFFVKQDDFCSYGERREGE